MNTLSAGTLRLEPLVADHAAEMFSVLSDPAIYEYENSPPESLAWLQARYAKLEGRGPADGSQKWLNWVIRLPSGALAGYVQATVMQNSTAYIAYELGSRFWHQGIASASVRAVLFELRQTYHVTTALAVLKAVNQRSHRLLTSQGFTEAAPLQSVRPECDSDELVMYMRLVGPEDAV